MGGHFVVSIDRDRPVPGTRYPRPGRPRIRARMHQSGVADHYLLRTVCTSRIPDLQNQMALDSYSKSDPLLTKVFTVVYVCVS